MENQFYKIFGISVICLIVLLIFRNLIWWDVALTPADKIMIYQRDSGNYFVILRMIFLLLCIWGAYLIWTTGKAGYLWATTFAYASFQIADSVVLGHHFLQFDLATEPWKTRHFFCVTQGVAEALMQILFWTFVARFLGELKQKRVQLEKLYMNK